MGCFSRPSSISDGSRAQPMQARLSATFEGAPLPSAAGGATVGSTAADSAAGGAAVAALAASLSAFSAVSAARTSLEAAPSSGCCSCSLASSGLKPRSGSATRRPRTAFSRRSSDIAPRVRAGPPVFGGVLTAVIILIAYRQTTDHIAQCCYCSSWCGACLSPTDEGRALLLTGPAGSTGAAGSPGSLGTAPPPAPPSASVARERTAACAAASAAQ